MTPTAALRPAVGAALLLAAAAAAAAAPTPVAEYAFGNSLASSVAGAPSLVAVDPLGVSGFATDTVLGSSRTVWQFGGTSDNASQGGLSLDIASLLPRNNLYSVQIVFKFTENENRWRRIVDVDDRQSDNGFYVDPQNRLDIFPVAGGAAFSNDVYHDVVLSNDRGSVTFFLDGGTQATVNTTVMDLTDSNGRMNFFLDNVVAGGQHEYSSGSVALIRIFDTALVPADVVTLPPIPAVPEPTTWALLAGGLGIVAWAARRSRRDA